MLVDQRSLLPMCDDAGNKRLMSVPEYLSQNGILVKIYSGPDDIFHHKLVLIDDQFVIDCSMNWTYQDLNYDLNHYMVIHHNDVCNHVARWFQRFWQRQDLSSLPINHREPQATLMPQARVHFSDEESLKTVINDILNRAEHTVEVMHFVVNSSWFLNCIKNVISRGVRVRILSNGESIPFLRQAANLGALVKVLTPNHIKKLHHKTIIVDGRFVLVGSVNLFDRSLQLDKEHLFVFHAEHIADGFSSEFERIWSLHSFVPSSSDKTSIRKSPMFPIMSRLLHGLMSKHRLITIILAALLCLASAANVLMAIYILRFG